MRHIIILSTTLLIATTALAHDGVKNKAVLERMMTMGAMKDAIQVMGKMANQAVPFDAALAGQARADMITATSQISSQFETMEMDPKSEAKLTIWETWLDFDTKAKASVASAQAVQTDTLLALQQSLAPLGDSCSSCHKAYRVKKK